MSMSMSMLVIAFLPRSKYLLISWLQSPSTVILEPKKIKSITVSIVSPSICYEVMGPDMWTTVLSNSMKLWAMPCRAPEEGWVMVESSDKMWSTGEGNGTSLQYSCLENPMNSMKRQKDMTMKDELLRSVGAQYATGNQWWNNFRKNETEPNQKQHSCKCDWWWK